PALRSIADPVAHHRRCGRATMAGAGQGGSVSRLRPNPWDAGRCKLLVSRLSRCRKVRIDLAKQVLEDVTCWFYYEYSPGYLRAPLLRSKAAAKTFGPCSRPPPSEKAACT